LREIVGTEETGQNEGGNEKPTFFLFFLSMANVA
jgi:hypothetical protein